MYKMIFTRNGKMDTRQYPVFHELMDAMLDLYKQGFEDVIILDELDRMIYKRVEFETLDDDDDIAMRESLGGNWW